MIVDYGLWIVASLCGHERKAEEGIVRGRRIRQSNKGVAWHPNATCSLPELPVLPGILDTASG
jgi:hypothetical protein